ncbi:uncharacterized protein LOC143085417 isoform X2 [Mytilus galloprovincialis]|uniref:uncharacterized protein LOC143085417 isoform X2 n=1 Tax=Mytilus galloprovincialis TaxID=29158 RepID=UPI003F7C87B3
MYFVGFALLLSQIVCCNCMISLTATPLINVFTSHPGYDGHVRYPDGNYTQDWYLTTNWINHTIKIHFATCFIENSKGVCLFDYLYVYDGANSSSPELLKTCCGKAHSATLESSTGEMYIFFETDNTVGDTGFEIEYWSNGITTTTTTTTVAPTTEINTDTTTMQISTAGKTTTMQISSAGKTTNSASSSATSDKSGSSDASVISTITSSSHEPKVYTASTILDQNIQTTTGYFSQTSDISTSHASGSSKGESFSTETQTSNQNAYSSTASITAPSTATNKETIGESFSTETQNPNAYSSTTSIDSSSTVTNKGTIDQNSHSSVSAFTGTTITITHHNSASSNTTAFPSTVSDDGKDTSTDSTYTTAMHINSVDTTTHSASNSNTSYTTDENSPSSASAFASTTIAQPYNALLNTTTSPSIVSDAGNDNSRYIIIACVVTGLLVIIVAVLIVVMVMKKNKAATYPRPFLVDDGKPIQPDSRNTKFKNGQKKMAFPAPPPTPPLHTIMPQTETNLFDLELPEKGRANRLPPLYSSIATSNTN